MTTRAGQREEAQEDGPHSAYQEGKNVNRAELKANRRLKPDLQ